MVYKTMRLGNKLFYGSTKPLESLTKLFYGSSKPLESLTKLCMGQQNHWRV